LTVAAVLSCVSRAVVAVFSAVSLLALLIEPVLSSTSATRRRVLPHLIVAVEPMSIFVKPIIRVKVVGMRPLAVMRSCVPALAVYAVVMGSIVASA